jgi:hypothetical protein
VIEATMLNFLKEPAKQRCFGGIPATSPLTIKLAKIGSKNS